METGSNTYNVSTKMLSDCTMDYPLKNINSDDLDELLFTVERTFNLEFEFNELRNLNTFGELCDHISNKIALTDSRSCTTQQAFYKLRKALALTLSIDSKNITPQTDLSTLLPLKNRMALIRKTEQYLGFHLNVLRPKRWIVGTCVILFFSSLLALYFHWLYTISGICISILGLWLANSTGKVLQVKTVGELSKKMVTENYINSRSDSSTYNKLEVESILVQIFSEGLQLDPSLLSRD